MNRAGVETWLMHVLRHIGRGRFQMDFLVHTSRPSAYDDEIRMLGACIIPCLSPSQPWAYARNFQQILREHGPYDVVHSHVHHYSGYVLRLAHKVGVPIRIAHSHSDTSALQATAGLARRMYLAMMSQWIQNHATVSLAASRKAATALFDANRKTSSQWQLLYYGVDLTSFQNSVESAAIRAELGLPADAFVVGHVGRFIDVKNHEFLVQIAVEIAKCEPRMRLLLVGDGPLRPALEKRVAVAGLADHVVFAGLRSDVHRLMLGAMDVFVLPSLYEGLPLVLIEAQASGLPCIFSDVITEEADIVKPLVQRLSLSQPASMWAEAVLFTRAARASITRTEALAIMEQSPFGIQRSSQALEAHYSSVRYQC